MINISKLINISQYSDYNLNENLEWNDILTYYIRLFQFIGVSTLYIGFIAYGTYSIKNYYKKSNQNIFEEENEQEIPYEMKFFQEYDEMDDGDEDGDDEDGDEDGEEGELTQDFVNNLSLKTITETTPRGDVLMYYSSKLNSFVYHSKTKEIPYKYLETVARKYVIEYKCKKLYIDIRKEYEKGLHKYNEIKEKEERGEKGEENKDSNNNKKKQIFAKFKTYNRKGEVHNKQKDKIYILREQSNRYSYRGKIEEYNQKNIESCLDKKVIEEITNGNTEDKKIKDIDFASFKKMYMK
jgi:hypothetical protein